MRIGAKKYWIYGNELNRMMKYLDRNDISNDDKKKKDAAIAIFDELKKKKKKKYIDTVDFARSCSLLYSSIIF